MKPTLYEALGLSRTATEAEIKAALRRLVRRYYTKTRAGHADVEEALRFLNHASHILGNAARRAEYDANLAESSGASTAPAATGTFQGEMAFPGQTALGDVADTMSSVSQLGVPQERPAPPPELAPELSAKLADIRRTRAGQLTAFMVALALLFAAWIFGVPRGQAAAVIGFAITMLVVFAAIGAVTWGIVHLLSRSLWPLPAPERALTLVEGMIPRWRKDRTVFLGTGAPVEDATWLFRLRMAELKRVKAERVSDPHPAMRLFARLFDYALWGLAYAAVAGSSAVPESVSGVLLHPLVATILVPLTWIPIEAILLTRLQTTPGRWLLCVYLQHGVSNPYAPEELRFTFATAAARAADVWWRGCAAWLPGVSLVTAARACERMKRTGETRWDSERDCLVTHGPVGGLGFAALALVLLACAIVYAAHWRDPVRSGASTLGGMLTRAAPQREPEKVAPATSAPQPRIQRLDDESPGAAPADAPSERVADAGTTATGPAADPSSAASTAGGSASGGAAPSAAVNDPPLTPSVATKRAMAVENSKPEAVRRVEEASEAATATAGTPPATAGTPPATASTTAPATPSATAPASPPAASATTTAPAASSPPASSAATTPVAPVDPAADARSMPGAPAPRSTPPSADAADAAGASPSWTSSFNPKTFFANLFRKQQPVEPPPAPAAPEESRAPTAQELRDRRVSDYMRQAQRQQSAGDYAGMIRTCTKWADDDWKNARAYFCIGLGLQGTGQHKQAIAMLNKAGSLLPRDDPLKQQISDAVIRSFRAQGGG